MLIGHFAVAIASKRVAPRLSLGVTFIACMWADIVWPVLLLAGVERAHINHTATVVTPLALEHMPWSHSLLMSVVWSVLFFAVARGLGRETRESVVLGCVVFSHFILDVLTHRPDMPLAFGDSPKLGLGLWGSLPGTLVVEVGLYAVALALHARATRAKDAWGRWGFWSFIVVLAVFYLGNLFGPKPPEDLPTVALASGTIGLMVLAISWAFWVDRHREPVS